MLLSSTVGVPSRCVDDIVARLGGDEFAVLLREADGARAERVARLLLDALEQPFSVAGYTLGVGGSIGIALAPQQAADPDMLLRVNVGGAVSAVRAAARAGSVPITCGC